MDVFYFSTMQIAIPKYVLEKENYCKYFWKQDKTKTKTTCAVLQDKEHMISHDMDLARRIKEEISYPTNRKFQSGNL